MRLPLFLTILVGAVLAAVACSSPTESGASGVTTLQITDITVGTGTVATSGKSVTVHYTGWLYNTGTADHHGSKFDSSRDRGQPFTFVLGTGQVIAGWDQGVAGMKVGGQRTLVIPPSLAYGDRSPGSGIPPNATLVFDIELLDVK